MEYFERVSPELVVEVKELAREVLRYLEKHKEHLNTHGSLEMLLPGGALGPTALPSLRDEVEKLITEQGERTLVVTLLVNPEQNGEAALRISKVVDVMV